MATKGSHEFIRKVQNVHCDGEMVVAVFLSGEGHTVGVRQEVILVSGLGALVTCWPHPVKVTKELKGFDKSTIMDSNISDLAIQLIGSVIESVYSKDGKEVFMLDDYSEEERSEFYSSLSAKNFSEIQKFIASAPYLYAKIEWEEQDGNMKERELKGLLDFFTFA